MTKHGDTERECVYWIEDTVANDLNDLLDPDLRRVAVKLFTRDEDEKSSENEFLDDSVSLDTQTGLDSLEFTDYNMNPDLLEVVEFSDLDDHFMEVKSNKLRSACRVTHQPDHGTVYVRMVGKRLPTQASLLKFIVSFRNEYHFHEEICEAIFKTLQDKFHPKSLVVACNYTRRGGWDINPIRATHMMLIPGEWQWVDGMLTKTIKQ